MRPNQFSIIIRNTTFKVASISIFVFTFAYCYVFLGSSSIYAQPFTSAAAAANQFQSISFSQEALTVPPGEAASNNSLVSLFNRLSDSTVQIISTSPKNAFNPNSPNITETGAGFVYDRTGHIVTGNHVLGGATTVDVVLTNGDIYTARLIGNDPYTDLAVLRIEGISNTTTIDENTGMVTNSAVDNTPDLPQSEELQQPQQELQTGQQELPLLNPIPVGNSSEIQIGEQVITIGYPLGGADTTITSGIVGQKDYLLQFPSLGYSVPNTIQSDINVNPGNSGGPLMNNKGEVIGIIYGRINPTGAPLGQFPGLTVAIPSSAISRIVSVLIENGTYVHPTIGIFGSTLTVNLAERFSVPRDLDGVFINNVVRGSTADMAGIEGSTTNNYGETVLGDIITAVDGSKIIGIEDLISYVQEKKAAGEDIVFTVYRNGQFVNLNTTLQGIPIS
ncbi:MAG: S1C family serine protease [Nitrososphaeraceae archaeon]